MIELNLILIIDLLDLQDTCAISEECREFVGSLAGASGLAGKKSASTMPSKNTGVSVLEAI